MQNKGRFSPLKGLLIAASVVASVSPAMANSDIDPRGASGSISIGVLDFSGDRLAFSDPLVSVEFRSYVPSADISAAGKGETGLPHGVTVVSAMVDEIRKIDPKVRINIYSADVFPRIVFRNLDGTSRPGHRVTDIDAARKAMAWFKQNNVRVVSMAFRQGDNPALRQFISDMSAQGFVMVAPTPNTAGANMIFPAGYDGVISVAGVAKDLPASQGHYGWADFAVEGEWFFRGKREFGSSTATARLSGMAAYYDYKNPGLSTDEVKEGLLGLSEKKVVASRDYKKDAPAMNFLSAEVWNSRFEMASQSAATRLARLELHRKKMRSNYR